MRMKVKSAGIYAVAFAAFVAGSARLARNARQVVEDVAKMRATTLATHLHTAHAEGGVLAEFDILAVRGLGETRPAGAGIEFRVRGEQLRAAGGAGIHSRFLRVHVFAREGRLGPLLTHHRVLPGGERLLPILFVFVVWQGVRHTNDTFQ